MQSDECRCPWPQCRAVFQANPRVWTAVCPGCQQPVSLRPTRFEAVLEERRLKSPPRPEDVTPRRALLVDDVRSLWNVGSMFRTCDGLGVEHLFLCGITGVPPHPELHRTALGAEDAVSWSYHAHPFDVLLAQQGYTVVALECSERSIPLHEVRLTEPWCLVVGNEWSGIAPEVLAVSMHVAEIPMHGVKRSLNVAVACGVALYQLGRSTATTSEVRPQSDRSSP